MGCPSEVVLEDNLVFSVCTHDPDTAVVTDADAAPTYRVYEDETGTAILTGSMAKLDDANTTGFYTELIACTAANGFETGKTYTIYIEATVGGDTGATSFGFTVAGGKIGTPVALDGGAATIAGMLAKMADDSGGAAFDASYDSLHHLGQDINTMAANFATMAPGNVFTTAALANAPAGADIFNIQTETTLVEAE